MATVLNPVGKSRLVEPPHAVKSEQTPLDQSPTGTSSLQFTAGIVVLVAAVLWGLWLFTDMLLKLVY